MYVQLDKDKRGIGNMRLKLAGGQAYERSGVWQPFRRMKYVKASAAAQSCTDTGPHVY
jgi:hypothetical protein